MMETPAFRRSKFQVIAKQLVIPATEPGSGKKERRLDKTKGNH